MSKRFTATDKWTDPWFCSLSERDKLFWIYLLDSCDHAGIWKANWLLAEFYFPGCQRNLDVYGSRVIKIDDEKFFIPKFIEFQQKVSVENLNPENKAHLGILRILEKYNLAPSKGLTRGSKAPKVKVKVKVKVKDKVNTKDLATEQPKVVTPIQKVVLAYKVVTGHDINDKSWDKVYFPRFSRSASQLLEFLGSWQDASDCIEDIYRNLTSKGLTVTLETIVKHAGDWKKDKQEREGKKHGVFPLQSHGGLPFKLRTVDEIASS